MLRLRFSPQWFYGYDAAVDIIAVVVVALIAFYAYRIYKYSDRKRDLYFALSFFSMALAFLSKIAMNLVIYYPKVNEVAFQTVNLTMHYTGESRILYIIGFALYRLLMLMGLLGIYYIVTKEKNRYNILMALLFSIMFILFSSSQYFVFHVASAIILGGIVYNYLWYFRKKKSAERLLVGWSFAAILMGQIVFILTLFHDYWYVGGQILQLVGFLILAYTFYNIMKK